MLFQTGLATTQLYPNSNNSKNMSKNNSMNEMQKLARMLQQPKLESSSKDLSNLSIRKLTKKLMNTNASPTNLNSPI
jgi:hypothetical protein